MIPGVRRRKPEDPTAENDREAKADGDIKKEKEIDNAEGDDVCCVLGEGWIEGCCVLEGRWIGVEDFGGGTTAGHGGEEGIQEDEEEDTSHREEGFLSR